MASGSPSRRVFAFYDQASSSWRTWLLSAGEASTAYSAIWPSLGMTRTGSAFALQIWERLIVGSESSSWPTDPKRSRSFSKSRTGGQELFRTPLVSDAHGAQHLHKRMSRGRQVGLNDQAVTLFPLSSQNTVSTLVC